MKLEFTATVDGTARFHTTRWSVIIAAAQNETRSGQAALAKLCRVYWYPLFAFARRRGHSPHDAQDLTQGFFLHLLRNRAFTGLIRSGQVSVVLARFFPELPLG